MDDREMMWWWCLAWDEVWWWLVGDKVWWWMAGRCCGGGWLRRRHGYWQLLFITFFTFHFVCVSCCTSRYLMYPVYKQNSVAHIVLYI